MMLNLSKSAISALFLCCSTGFAGTMGPTCAGDDVLIPCIPGLKIGGAGLYLQDSIESMSQFGGRTDNGGMNHFDHNNQWAWGFMIDVGYHFDTGKDLSANWYHYDRKSLHILPQIVDRQTSVTSPGPNVVTVNPNWDAVNVEFGQMVFYGASSKIRYYGGFEYVNLKHRRNGFSSSFDGFGASGEFSSEYNGYGGRVGAKGWYSGLLSNLALYADAAIGLTAGNSSYRTLFTLNRTGSVIGDKVDASITVPQLEAKLGGSYSYMISYSTLSLDAGWLWVTYFDPLVEISHDDLSYYNASFQGPYVGLKWQGDVV